MKIELDGIKLNESKEDASGISDGRNIQNLNITDKRNSVPHDLPGMMGSVFQDLGRAAVKISFDGVISGDNAKTLLESIRGKFQKGDPVPFNSDLSGTADITKVLIDDFHVIDNAGNKNRYNYSIVLKEYKEPPLKSLSPESLESAAAGWAEGMVDKILADAKNEAVGYVSSKLGGEAGKAAGAAFDMAANKGKSEAKDGLKSLF
ncbi:MAG TPA: hypothetical protein VMC84_04555 [Methanocella sp.]|uniref:hypothetical protein n=1 Tax=Methanocella sp. TaxID=2052833 RepID=UPI002CC77A5D|nr:hypothetical protein [Methanocella sp.]HTY90427.1 hypothetical protein [Methanocella sp.]